MLLEAIRHFISINFDEADAVEDGSYISSLDF